MLEAGASAHTPPSHPHPHIYTSAALPRLAQLKLGCVPPIKDCSATCSFFQAHRGKTMVAARVRAEHAQPRTLSSLSCSSTNLVAAHTRIEQTQTHTFSSLRCSGKRANMRATPSSSLPMLGLRARAAQGPSCLAMFLTTLSTMPKMGQLPCKQDS
eukprot:1152400-Pelagomonas_calceolata.AAC.3